MRAIAYRSLGERPGRWGHGPAEACVRVCVCAEGGGLGPGSPGSTAPCPGGRRPGPALPRPAESRARPAAVLPGPWSLRAGRGERRRDVASPPSPPEREEPSRVSSSEIKANRGGWGGCALIISMCLMFSHRCNLFKPGLFQRKPVAFCSGTNFGMRAA